LRQYLLELRIYLVVSGRRYQLEQILAQQLFFLHEPKVYIVHCDVHANAVPVQKEHGI
jgi:hypothetical protein